METNKGVETYLDWGQGGMMAENVRQYLNWDLKNEEPIIKRMFQTGQ